MNYRRVILFFGVFSIFIFFSSNAFSSNFKIKTGISYLSGCTNYDIQFYENNPYVGRIDVESKLEFDLNAFMIDIGFEAAFFNDHFILEGTYSSSIAEPGGTLRDRDWIYNRTVNSYYTPLMGDTDSDIESEISGWDIKGTYFFPRIGRNGFIEISLGTGIQFQEIGPMETSNIEGFYEGMLSETGERLYVSETYSSPVLSYTVEYLTLYAEPGVHFHLSPWHLYAGIRIGSVEANDKDDHILREKISEAETDGTSIGLKLEAERNFSSYFRLKAYFLFTSLETDGYQTQYFYNSKGIRTQYIGTIYDEITSDQSLGGVFFLYEF